SIAVSAMLSQVVYSRKCRVRLSGGGTIELLAQSLQTEVVQALFVAVELFSQIRQDGVTPDEVHPLLVEIGAHEVAGADGCMPLTKLTIRLVDHSSHPSEVGMVLLQPALQQSLNGRLIGEERHEVEA